MSNLLKALCIVIFWIFLSFHARSQSEVPTMIFPAHGAVFLPGPVNFEWNITVNAAAYHLQVSEDISFSTAAYNNASIPTASQLVSGLPNNKDLYWRVRAYDGVDSSAWSAIYSFHLLNPRSLGNMQLWVRADSGVVASGNAVTVWTDYSGNGVQVTQNTDASRRPTLTTASQLNNAPVLRFDGTDYLEGGQALELRTNDQTILIVFNALNTGNVQYRLIQKRGHSPLTDGWALAARNITAAQGQWNSSVIEESNAQLLFQNGCCVNDGNYRIVSTVWDNSEALWNMQVNTHIPSPPVTTTSAGLLGGTDIAQNANKIMTIGCSWNSYTDLNFFLNGNIAEIMVYHTALDSISRLRATEYLRTKYAPALNLGRDIYNPSFCNVTINAAKPYFTKYFWYNLDEPAVLLADSLTGTALTVSEPGIYRLQVVDIFGRISSDTIRVDYPEVNVHLPAGDTAICGGDTIRIDSLLGGSYHYLWSTGDTTEALAIASPGLYFVEVAYTGFESCAITSDSFFVDVDAFSSIATLGQDDTFCTGNSLRLLAGAEDAVNYLWSDSSTGPELTLFTSGQYWLRVTDSIGCEVTDTIHATVIPGILPFVTFDADSVCFGAATSFDNNTSILSGAVASYLWEFGDNTTDTLTTPAHTYPASGYFNVRLTATSDVGCSNDVTKTVLVFATPVIDYSSALDSAGCIGTSYTFSDSSSSATPPDFVNQWSWDFGDSNTSTQRNPVHSYNAVGTYDIILHVETQRGCEAQDTNTVILLDGIPDPEPFSLYSPVYGAVIGNSTILFEWNPSVNAHHYVFQLATTVSFAPNSIVAQAEIFSEQYTLSNINAGVYYWRVIALNLCGTQVIADYFPLTLFGNGLISGMQLWLRSDKDVLSDSLNRVSAWYDQSGNGVHFFQTNSAKQPILFQNGINNILPVVTFNSGAGTFMDGGNKLDLGTNDQSLFVVFNSTNNPSDQYRIIQKRGTAGNLSYAAGWCLAARGGKLTPSFIQNQNDDIHLEEGTEYLLNNGCFRLLTTVWDNSEGTWDLFINGSLEESNYDGGAANSSFTTSKNLTLGCAYDNPSVQSQFLSGSIAEVLIFDNALSVNSRKLVEEYLRQKYFPPVNLGQDIELSYGFCSGTQLCAPECRDCGVNCAYQWSTFENTQCIIAPGQGVYAVTVTDKFGFSSSDSVIIKGGFNTVSFSDTVYVCMGDTLLWDTKLDTVGYTFQWQDGSGNSYYKISEAGQYWVYVEDTIGCDFTSDTLTVLIDSFSVEATLGSDTSLCAKNSIALTVGAASAIQYLWSDNSTGSELQVFTTGDYAVTVANVNRCLMFDSIHVEIVGVAPDANFSYSRTCLNDSTFFVDETPQLVETWNWSFGDGSNDDTVQNPAHLFSATGFYDVRLTVKDTGVCFQSVTRTVEVLRLPVAGFTNDLINCANDVVHFYDSSSAPAGQTVTDYLWLFGDGNASASINPVNNFAAEGFYPISLTVTTDSGCSSMVYDTLEIFPELQAEIDVGNLCLDYPVDFHDASPGFSNVAWYWTLGNGTVSTLENPVYTYPQAGTYVITLEVRNAIGCERTVKDTITVTARPVVDFENNPVCEGAIYFFADSSIVHPSDAIVSRLWNFGDQMSSTLQNPTHRYDSAGTYSVKLTVQTRNGCENSATKPMVVLAPPTAAFDFSPGYGAAPLPVSFTNQSQGGTDYLWNFGDNSAASDEINPEHTYMNDGSYTITLITVNAAGCSDTITDFISVSVVRLDLALDKIFVDKSSTDLCSYSLDLYAGITDNSTVDVASFDIRASVIGQATISEHWTGSFINRNLTYDFNAAYNIYDCSDAVVICMEVLNPNGLPDDNPENNYTCITLNDEFTIIGPAPNPTGDFIHIKIITPAKGSLFIRNYDGVGQYLGALKQEQLEEGFHQYRFDVSHLPQGVYLLRIEFNEDSKVLKFAKW